MSLKQVIVVRRDINMSRGKLAAQSAHAALTAADRSPLKKEWIDEGQKKVVLRCDTLDELLQLFESARSKRLPCSIIRDAGKTQLSEGTVTCIAIGPEKEQLIDSITGNLKLI